MEEATSRFFIHNEHNPMWGVTIWEAMSGKIFQHWSNGSESIPFSGEPYQTLFDHLKVDNHKDLIESKLRPGRYYQRIARPRLPSNPNSIHLCSPSYGEFKDQAHSSRNQLSYLMDKLRYICFSVQPSEENLGAYGHAIRNALIISCTEVEAQWKGVLDANNYKSASGNDRYYTNDYIKLSDPMKLKKYSVRYTEFPWLPYFSPFENWSNSSPTKSLNWYDAYNKVKHDRESNFPCANLNNLLNAISAIAILLHAQYENENCFLSSIGSIDICQRPEWNLEEYYIMAWPRDGGWVSTKFYFE